MSKHIVFSIAWLGLVLACATSRPLDTQASDAMITSTIESKLAANPETNNFEVDVDTQDGVVYLRGVVETEQERAEAERLAKNTEGVKRVVNELERGDLTIGENVDDAWILTKVKSQLAADPETNALNIDVDVTDGQVTLSGVVRDEGQRSEAERIAKATQGVTSVQNEIKVR